ncbi:hypothetical protein [Bradyrhizobium sp. OK095]|uniref:hypothetical protein n=1 Tax=Bradyrhizobium sp. OK095 TaxID=1882760 RepID=UPI000B89FE26|nr:hypothetical protein [Bradyrhizobium sp. OK095]
MARRLRTDAQIDNFIRRVRSEAEHHAPGVAAIIEPLSDAVRERLDLSVDRIEVYERNGRLARTCWVTISGHRYSFSYNYSEGMIDLRDGGLQGPLLHQFDNNTSQREVRRQARQL